MPTPTNTVSIAASLAGQHQTLTDIFNLVLEELKAIRRAMGSSTGASAGILRGDSAAYDPASVADAESLEKEVTVTGAALGDFALASLSVDLAGLSISALVSAADTVTVVLQNDSGGAVDLAAGTIARVLVIPKAAVALPAMTLTS